MASNNVTHQIKLPVSLTIILGLIAFGLVANVVKPALNINEAFASAGIQKIAICNKSGSHCAGVTPTRNGHLMVTN